MRKILLVLSLLIVVLSAKADEGMWFLKLMEQQHLADSLRKAGIKIAPNMLYREDGTSLKNVVGIFGAGCTGEIVSPNGLVFTNNHCGYSYINQISTVKNNYLRDGFFAKSMSEELPTPGLTFTFVTAIKNVTAQVEAAAKSQNVDVYTMQSHRFLNKLAKQIYADSLKKSNSTEVSILPFYGGNIFYAIFSRTYEDVRLVADPPIRLAQFGDNSDNWMWPRHNVDFCAYRVYADKKGRPAPYSKKNVPLKTPEFLRISLQGINKGDFSMIMGFPGRTKRYLTAAEIKFLLNTNNTPTVLAGWPELDFNRIEMAQSDSARLALQDLNMMLGNVVKNYDGMLKAVPATQLIEKKLAIENQFSDYAQQVGNTDYQTIVSRIARLCEAYTDTVHDYTLMARTVSKNTMKVNIRLMEALLSALENNKDTDKALSKLDEQFARDFHHFNVPFNIRRLKVLLPIWQQNCKLPEAKTIQLPTPESLQQSIFATPEAFANFKKHPNAEALKNDPVYRYWTAINAFRTKVSKSYRHFNELIAPLNRTYIKGLLAMYNNSKAPDANFSLRMTYGHVSPYSPRDAVHYDWRTTLKGMFEKENPNDDDYKVDERVRQLYLQRNFGRYAREDGELPTCFITNNDITGGNSGSPVLNAQGHLIGLAFDGNIEGLSSDLMYNPKLQRCICVDARYVLWTLDIYGEAKYLFDEMVIE